MLYPLAAEALTARGQQTQHGGRSTPRAAASSACTSPEALATLSHLPPARLLAPLDLGAYAIGATRLAVVGAPYHRNNAGNVAVYRFFLGRPDQAATIARTLNIRYVALCADSFAELDMEPPLAAQLRAGHPPRWLRPLGKPGNGLALYGVEPGLFDPAPPQ
jgi:hypothetical protein